MAMTVRVSEHDVADAIRKGDLSLGIIMVALAQVLHNKVLDTDDVVRPAADYVRSFGNPDATRAMLRDLLTQSERPTRAAG